MSAITLHELGHARDIIDEWLEETGGEVTPELEQLMTELGISTEEKIVNTALYIREQIATSLAIQDEITRLEASRDARKNHADRLKRYLEGWMGRIGKAKVVDPRCTVALQVNPPSVKGDLAPETLEALHAEGSPLVRFRPATYELNRTAVKDLDKAGGEIPAGLTIERSSSLRIR